ncbi:hypothetical protein PJ912_27750 [Pectobacterium colocasium]|uniref:hypothetical protein n=1 Tax=Pectobacterium TaxID=122277 RepID=UPI003D759AC6
MENSKSFNNPLIGVRIGSTISGNEGRFSPSIIIENITRMIPEKEVVKSMTGKSLYVYTDELNQGSLGVAGGYGVSGVSKLTSSLSTYVGNATASSSKSINVNYNVTMLSGMEYIDFDDLKAEDIINSLKSGPKHLALDVLNKFNAVRGQLGGVKSIPDYVKNSQSDSADVLMLEWVNSLQKFVKQYGDGVVVGVIWGGLGTVSMSMSSSEEMSDWKYGGNADFSYSDVGTAVSVKATYDGGNSKSESKVNVGCTSWSSGGCVADQVDEWFKVVENKAFTEIAEIKLLEKAPTINTVAPPPVIPDFQKPESDPEVTDEVKKIENLDDLDTFSVASGYEKAKEVDKNLTLDEFIKKANESADAKNVEELKEDVKNNDVDVLHPVNKSIKVLAEMAVVLDENMSELSDDDFFLKDKVDSSLEGDYTVLGAWIANWSDIFPWMSTGYLNEISNTLMAQELLKKQCMIQDLLALSNLYYALESCKIDLAFCKIKSALQIANSFGQSLSYLKSVLDKDDAIEKTFKMLSDEAKIIYKKWNDIKFLRSAELGLGLLSKSDNSITDQVLRVESHPYRQVIYKADYCSYGTGNYSAFSAFLKLLPLIGVDGEIYAFGPSSMLLRSVKEGEITFTKGGVSAMRFQINADEKVLENSYAKLIPLPFTAADNVRWRGQGFSTNLSAISTVNEHLDKIIKELGELNVCTFSSEGWDKDWNYTKSYNLRALKTQYVGLVEEVKNVFGH